MLEFCISNVSNLVELNLLFYIITLMLFLNVLTSISYARNNIIVYLVDLSSYSRFYFISYTLIFIIFLLAGVPPMTGFIGKLILLLSSLKLNPTYLTVYISIFFFILLLFYLNILKYLREGTTGYFVDIISYEGFYFLGTGIFLNLISYIFIPGILIDLL